MAEPARVAALAALLLVASCASLGLGTSAGVQPVCGRAAIRGEPLPRIADGGGCGVRRPVRVHAVSGVALVPPVTIDCETARALNAWVARGAKPAASRARERLAAIETAGGYACRRRNHAAGGPLSEHARGRAVDVAGFRFASGRRVRVETGWRDPRDGAFLARAHAAACGPFRTTLGPGSDGFHEDHLHFDLARHDGGRRYCR